MGSIDCDPDISRAKSDRRRGQGLRPCYGPNGFDTNPLCPNKNSIFNLPNPGTPCDDWPPYRVRITTCHRLDEPARTRVSTTASSGTNNGPCPADIPRYRRTNGVDPASGGRNYWHDANNAVSTTYNFAHTSSGHRLQATGSTRPTRGSSHLFFTPYDSFVDGGREGLSRSSGSAPSTSPARDASTEAAVPGAPSTTRAPAKATRWTGSLGARATSLHRTLCLRRVMHGSRLGSLPQGRSARWRRDSHAAESVSPSDERCSRALPSWSNDRCSSTRFM